MKIVVTFWLQKTNLFYCIFDRTGWMGGPVREMGPLSLFYFGVCVFFLDLGRVLVILVSFLGSLSNERPVDPEWHSHIS